MTRENTRPLDAEQLETRETPAATPDLAGVVRDGHTWFLAGNQTSSTAAQVRSFGAPGDRYLSGDWNDDVKTDLIAVHPNAAGGLTWTADTDGDGQADARRNYGLAADLPFVGDWNGDRRLDLGVARPDRGSGLLLWYLGTNRDPFGDIIRPSGLLSTDAPVTGDWNDDGKTDLGVTRNKPPPPD